MKKFLSIALILVMSLGLLAGCASEPSTPSGEGNDSDFKVGFIFLHDENSTYDKNFMDAANAALTRTGTTT